MSLINWSRAGKFCDTLSKKVGFYLTYTVYLHRDPPNRQVAKPLSKSCLCASVCPVGLLNKGIFMFQDGSMWLFGQVSLQICLVSVATCCKFFAAYLVPAL